jgi:hypothetical protein
MTIRKRAAGAVFASAATAMVIAFGASTALAATTLTVTVTNGGSYTATTNKTVLSDNGVNVNCTSTSTLKASKGTGTIATATHKGTSPVSVGTVKTLAFNNCTGPLGKVTTTVNTSTPYPVKVDSKTNTSGQTAGMITGVKVHVTMTGCSFNVTGSAPGFYTNGKHTLTVTPKPPVKPLNTAQLTVGSVSGCAGLVHNGDHPTFTGTYTVSRAIVIKSS